MSSAHVLPSGMTLPRITGGDDKGEIECKGTFEKRELTTEPKFVQRRRDKALCENNLENVFTFEKENGGKT